MPAQDLPEIADDDSVVVGGFLKSATEMLVGYLQEFNGKTYGHLRIMQPSAEHEGEWVHTKKGVGVEVSRLTELRDAVGLLFEVATLEKVVARLPLGADEIRVGVQPYAGNQYVYVRRFYRDAEGEWRPTQKGVNVRTDRLEDLADIMGKLCDAADRL